MESPTNETATGGAEVSTGSVEVFNSFVRDLRLLLDPTTTPNSSTSTLLELPPPLGSMLLFKLDLLRAERGNPVPDPDPVRRPLNSSLAALTYVSLSCSDASGLGK